MSEDTKQAEQVLTSDQILEKLRAIHEFSEDHPEPWKNGVAHDLNHLIGRAVWWIETDGDQIDFEFGAAVLRIVDRVAESEEIRAKGKPDERTK
jgi:hypothetical protein